LGYLALHEIGTDRAHHLFQRFWDVDHPQYVPDNPHEDKIPRYYRLVDELAGRLLKRLPGDVEVLVVSDHGNQAQRGVLALNQLLAEWGFLRFRREPSRGEDVNAVVDWGRSLAVAWGGYYARIFINASGEEAVDLKRELKRKLSVLKAPWGRIRNAVFEPSELYREVRMMRPTSWRISTPCGLGRCRRWAGSRRGLRGTTEGPTTRSTASTASSRRRGATRGVETSTRWTWPGFWSGPYEVPRGGLWFGLRGFRPRVRPPSPLWRRPG